ncbi:MAG: FAD-binding oxidoreductase [Mycobacteriaceae bacterium]
MTDPDTAAKASSTSGAQPPGVGRRTVLAAAAGLVAGGAAGRLTAPKANAANTTDASSGGPSSAGAPLPAVRVGPDDVRYPALTGGFNLRFTGTPAAVVVVSSPQQCLSAVRDALRAGQRITVRAGGHCYEGFVSDNPGGVIIDVSGMRRILSTPDGLVGLESGCTNWDVYERLYKAQGVTIPGGSCYSVGIGGHVVGGGYGLMSREFGLTVDYLAAVDVIVVDAQGRADLVHATAEDPRTADLFWAHTGGGGGSFGLITAYWFHDLPRPPEQVQLATVTWPWSGVDADAFATLVGGYGRWMSAHSAPGDPASTLFALLKLRHVSAEKLSMTVQASGTEPAVLDDLLRAVSAGLPAAARPSTTRRTLPWLAATQTLNGSGDNQRGKYKSAHLRREFPDDQVAAVHAALTDPAYSNPQALLQVDSYGCRINAIPPEATAVSQRSSVMKLQYQTYWTDAADDALNLGWMRRFYSSVYAGSGGEPKPDGINDGCYVNYPDVDLLDWPGLYFKDNYSRLQKAKAQWDPGDRFRHAQSVRLP